MKANYLSIVYVSTAASSFTQEHLIKLLEKSRKNNQQLGITGMLLHQEKNFMQVIEGPHDAVRKLHKKILSDYRHDGIIPLIEQEINEREFEHWSMAFRNLGNLNEEEAEGFSNLLNKEKLPKEFATDPSRAKKLLLSFRSNLRIS